MPHWQVACNRGSRKGKGTWHGLGITRIQFNEFSSVEKAQFSGRFKAGAQGLLSRSTAWLDLASVPYIYSANQHEHFTTGG